MLRDLENTKYGQVEPTKTTEDRLGNFSYSNGFAVESCVGFGSLYGLEFMMWRVGGGRQSHLTRKQFLNSGQ